MCVAHRRCSFVLSAVICVIVFNAGSSHVTAESGAGVRGARFTLTGDVKGAVAARDAIRCARRRVQAAGGDRFEVDGCRVTSGDSTVNNDTPVLHRVSVWKCSETACFLIVNDDQGTQAASRAKCRALHPAVDLLVIDSEEERLYFYHTLYLSHLFTPNVYYWLGIEETTGTLPGTWVDGSGASVVFQKWTPGEPDGSHETCAAVMFSFNTWVDYWCDHTVVNYVCKFRK